MSSSTKIDIRKKHILFLGKGPTQGLEHKLSAEKMYSINFTEHNKKFCLSLHYNGANSYLFVHGKEIHKFKAKDYEIVATPFCLGNISKDWSVDNMKKKWIKWICLWFWYWLWCYCSWWYFWHSQLLNEKDWHSITKCLKLIKRCLFTGLTFLSTLTSVNLLSAASVSCISMNNQECKVRYKFLMLIMKNLFFLLVLKQVNAAVVVTISIIHMQNSVFLMLLKILMLKYLI